jgi:hypothetical protein
MKVDYVIISGAGDKRLENAIKAISVRFEKTNLNLKP